MYDEPTAEEIAAVRYAPARELQPYLEHAGDINPEGWLEMLAESGIRATEEEPIVLVVHELDGQQLASIWDGNHRLIIAFEEDPSAEVPYVISRTVESFHPGFLYDGALG